MLEALLAELIRDVTHITHVLLKSHEKKNLVIETAPDRVRLNLVQYHHSLLLFTVNLQTHKVFFFIQPY